MTGFSLTSQQGVNGSRIDWVDYAKGLCIIFVVMMHSTLGVENHAFEKGLVEEGTVGWMNLIVTFAQPFRMPDFFLISGLFLGLVIGRSWVRYLDRKVIHFAYFYVLWLAIQMGFRSIGWINEGVGPTDIAGRFLIALIEPYGTLWFIYMLPVMFLITRLVSGIHWSIVLAAAAILEITKVHSGYMLIDEFAARYVYFFAGYALAKPIFRLAAWAQANLIKAAGYLIIWMVINGIFTFSSVPDPLVQFAFYDFSEKYYNFSHLPLISLALGAAGAVAIVCISAILSRFRFSAFLRYLGENSIVVYLAFFLPMIITREVLLRFAPWLDLGTMSLIVLAAGVIGPVIAHEFIRRTGWFTFLFKRPNWASIERKGRSQSDKVSLQPAE